jgi:hypothetical protein
LYKPDVTAHLAWWQRLGLAFVAFFRIIFDASFAAAVAAARSAGAEPAAPLAGAALAGAAGSPVGAASAATSERSDTAALVLLSLLQAEGRFVDFVQQDIGGFPDADIGAVARVVHAGCRKVLASHLHIAAIRGEPEGQLVALEPGFDPSRVKLTGNVSGSGRLSGVLRHRGWQATEVHLPTVIDAAGTRVLCPAEVEL